MHSTSNHLNPTPKNPRWLTIRDVSEKYAVHPNTVRGWINNGELPAYRIGGRNVRINPADVEKLLAPYTPTDAAVWGE